MYSPFKRYQAVPQLCNDPSQIYHPSPQNTANTSPAKDESTQRLTHHTAAEPKIPPSTLTKDLPRTRLSSKLHPHSLTLLIHFHNTLDLARITAREEKPSTCAARAMDQDCMEQA
jgi:hypothetical protein